MCKILKNALVLDFTLLMEMTITVSKKINHPSINYFEINFCKIDFMQKVKKILKNRK